MIPDFQKEVKFNLGQRVEVDLEEIPVEHRDTTTGTIVGMRADFPSTKELRKIRYKVRFDNKGNYVKKDCQFYGGISFEVIVSGNRLKALKALRD